MAQRTEWLRLQDMAIASADPKLMPVRTMPWPLEVFASVMLHLTGMFFRQ